MFLPILGAMADYSHRKKCLRCSLFIGSDLMASAFEAQCVFCFDDYSRLQSNSGLTQLMYLTNKFSSRFTGGVRSRGQSYFTDGHVEIVEGTKQTVSAIVAGSEEYDVLLTIRGRDLCVACSCPYFDNDVCKHIWATMAAAERKGYLTGAPSRLVMVDLDFELDDSDFGLDDADYNLDEDEDYRSKDRGARAVTHVPRLREPAKSLPVRPAAPPEWKRQIDSISRSMSGFAHERAAAWPSTRELFYIVEGQFPSNPGACNHARLSRDETDRRVGQASNLGSSRASNDSVARGRSRHHRAVDGLD
jgi:hypothetical protein